MGSGKKEESDNRQKGLKERVKRKENKKGKKKREKEKRQLLYTQRK